MTNTIIGVLFLMGAVLIISLYSCNRNNSKTETDNATEQMDSVSVVQKTDSLQQEVDSLSVEREDSLAVEEMIGGERIVTDDEQEIVSDKENATTQESITKDLKQKTSKMADADSIEKEQLSLKNNVDKPTASEGSGIKASSAIKDRQQDKNNRILIVGSGGGVTGEVREYRIEVDGSVYEKRSFGETASSKKSLKIDQFKKMNQLFDDLNIDTIKYDNPGNLYYFVGYELKGKMHKVTWGGINDTLPEKIKNFYEFAITQLSQ